MEKMVRWKRRTRRNSLCSHCTLLNVFFLFRYFFFSCLLPFNVASTIRSFVLAFSEGSAYVYTSSHMSADLIHFSELSLLCSVLNTCSSSSRIFNPLRGSSNFAHTLLVLAFSYLIGRISLNAKPSKYLIL